MSAPLLPDPGTAQEWLRRELERNEYHQGLLQRLQEWIRDRLGGLRGGQLLDVGWPVFLGVVVVLVAVLALVLSRLRRNPAAPSSQRSVFDDVRRTAAEHRALARAARDAGDLDRAVVEAMRALTSGLVERGLVPDLPAATAYEVVLLARPRFETLAARLDAGARLFDEVRYGGRPASASAVEEMLDLEQAVATTTPAGSSAAGGPTLAVPR